MALNIKELSLKRHK